VLRFERLQNADVRSTARTTTGEHEPDARPCRVECPCRRRTTT
jgi:hypothetical protein